VNLGHWPLKETALSNTKLLNNLKVVPAASLAPAPENIFKALELTAPNDVKVIALGQDPYIRGEAHGLAFSSQKGITPSLEIIVKELERTGFTRYNTDLTDWAQQGVLLLNTILTTKLGLSLAHKAFGWQEFTKEVVRHVLVLGNPIVIMLWGNVAKEFYASVIKGLDIDLSHVKVLTAVHPVAEFRGSGKFVGCNHFVLANEWLELHNLSPIKWNDND
jgi:uracil-DNA glycosylase